MENIIGLLHIGTDFEQNNNKRLFIKEALNDPSYSLVEITEKKQMSVLDGLIINLEKSSDSIQVFQWLIHLQEEYSLFIWILCGDEETELTKFYPHLSKNSVIEVFQSNQGFETLSIVVKNALNYKNHLLNQTTVKKRIEDNFLDSSKLSFVVHNKSIPLTRKEFKIVSLLYKNMGNVVTYHEINKEIYGDLTDTTIGKYRVANFIFSIRNKLKEQSYFEIEIVRTKGYILSCSENEKDFFENTKEMVL
ncbi:winged helix-turn-helix domain-containing protein [Enterococcus caccae]|uniref:OmpR/PhoB-type domain-containing protein n=1 Tax=Enterococcus caccae ATCC BAA-1240 TaxID=1158612 RepID=R3WX64_9ENTE|nr:winged helix-turn-helix domain-containing protein [Enterococcus caccae]EOL46365.1 hypothetical protein UC7_01332 [Enterococcus caccae ATCC BAA-1240]EOT60734.1 hypothetical protein I580_01634 [Enterococcus caccae ATCC BAA-1240]OJG27456.1 hypothetical protein RU98_GL002545 [Enterococcus caccae]